MSDRPKVWRGQIYSDPRNPGRSLRVEALPEDPTDPDARVRLTTLTGRAPGRSVNVKPERLTTRYTYRKG